MSHRFAVIYATIFGAAFPFLVYWLNGGEFERGGGLAATAVMSLALAFTANRIVTEMSGEFDEEDCDD